MSQNGGRSSGRRWGAGARGTQKLPRGARESRQEQSGGLLSCSRQRIAQQKEHEEEAERAKDQQALLLFRHGVGAQAVSLHQAPPCCGRLEKAPKNRAQATAPGGQAGRACSALPASACLALTWFSAKPATCRCLEMNSFLSAPHVGHCQSSGSFCRPGAGRTSHKTWQRTHLAACHQAGAAPDKL